MDDPFRHRDYLTQHVLAFGEPIAPEQLPESLAWRVWQPVTQRLYLWAWAVHRGYLYSRLDDADARGGPLAFAAPPRAAPPLARRPEPSWPARACCCRWPAAR